MVKNQREGARKSEICNGMCHKQRYFPGILCCVGIINYAGKKKFFFYKTCACESGLVLREQKKKNEL